MPVVLGAASAFTSQRVALYGLVSTLAALAVVFNAFRQRSNFYSAAVMLGGSNGCMMVLFNFGVFISICIGSLFQRIFFGPLRAVEVEHLHERLWYAITESLLAMTIFRDDFDSSFALLFGALLFLKVFHWLSADRVEFMDQSPSLSRWFHVRMVAILSMLFEFDLFLATFAVEVLIVDRNRKGIMIMFASEFFILGATLWSTIAKYLINCQDLRSEEPWQAKSLYVFAVDLVTDFLKLATYLACFCLILSYYGLPLNIIRDVYMTGRSFFGRLRDFVKYRAATRNMDTRFPDASALDLQSMSDRTCIICREEMLARNDDDTDEHGQARHGQGTASSGLNETPKKLPCGHIFHFHCLRSWLERQQSCPTCRRTVFGPANEGAQEGDVPGNRNAAGAGEVGVGQAGRPDGVGHPQQADPDRTAQEHLRSFMQQMQSDARRLRQQYGEAQERRTGLDGTHEVREANEDAASTAAGRSSETARSQPHAESSQSPARRMLINSLFAHQNTFRPRRADGNARSHSLLPPAPALQGLSGQASSIDAGNSLSESWIPPAPWTLKAQARQTEDRRDVSQDPNSDAKPASDHERAGSNGEKEEKAPQTSGSEPQDAREAARAAALKRFGVSQGSSANVTQATTTEAATASASTVRPPKPSIPGDPHLLPLFNAEAIDGFESSHASKLRYPLLRSAAPSFAPPHSAASSVSPESLVALARTAADLENLSMQTRRGLEERLRLLYGVESAVSLMVEEITRALSVIPTSDKIGDETQIKGKAPAEGLHARGDGAT